MDNQDQQQLLQQLGEQPAKEKKQKPSAEVFLNEWRAAVTSKKDPVPELRAKLKTAYAGEIAEEHLTEMIATFADHPEILERLALPLAVQARTGKQNGVSKRFLAKARAGFEQAIQFDRAEFATYRGPQNVEEWVKQHAPETPAAERDSWFRRFVVCLLYDAEPKTMLRGLLSASRRWLSSKGLKSAGNDTGFMRGVVGAIGAPGIAARRLDLVLSGVQLLEEQNRQILNRELSLERQLRSAQDEVDRLKREVERFRKDLDIAADQDKKKSAQIEELERALTSEKERYDLLDRHWRGVSEQELTKQSGSFRARVGQEVEEALLALDRDEPSVPIALRRLRRIQEILSKVKE